MAGNQLGGDRGPARCLATHGVTAWLVLGTRPFHDRTADIRAAPDVPRWALPTCLLSYMGADCSAGKGGCHVGRAGRTARSL